MIAKEKTTGWNVLQSKACGEQRAGRSILENPFLRISNAELRPALIQISESQTEVQ